MKRENYDFDICQNRSNSKETIILAMPKDRGDYKFIGVIQNKTGNIVIMDRHNFKEKTISDLKSKLKNHLILTTH